MRKDLYLWASSEFKTFKSTQEKLTELQDAPPDIQAWSDARGTRTAVELLLVMIFKSSDTGHLCLIYE